MDITVIAFACLRFNRDILSNLTSYFSNWSFLNQNIIWALVWCCCAPSKIDGFYVYCCPWLRKLKMAWMCRRWKIENWKSYQWLHTKIKSNSGMYRWGWNIAINWRELLVGVTNNDPAISKFNFSIPFSIVLIHLFFFPSFPFGWKVGVGYCWGVFWGCKMVDDH